MTQYRLFEPNRNGDFISVTTVSAHSAEGAVRKADRTGFLSQNYTTIIAVPQHNITPIRKMGYKKWRQV
jgi:hypothetical protein